MTIDIRIKELKGKGEISRIYPLLMQRYTDLSFDEFDALLDDMLPMGYRCVVALDSEGDIIGVSGFWIKSQFYCRRSLRIDNFIIDEGHRNMGVGASLLRWLQEVGLEEGCKMAILDSLTGNTQSHRFYFREGFSIIGFHFAKEL